MNIQELYAKKLFIIIHVSFNNDNSKKYYEFRENRDEVIIIASRLEIFLMSLKMIKF